MKVCITEHVVPSFGTVPVGSIWDDDSPYLEQPEHFADVSDEKPKAKPTRHHVPKFSEIDEVD
jgi:hypothetical protein